MSSLSTKEICLISKIPRVVSAVAPKRASTLEEASTEASPHLERLEPVTTGTSRCHILMVAGGHPAEETTLPADNLV